MCSDAVGYMEHAARSAGRPAALSSAPRGNLQEQPAMSAAAETQGRAGAEEADAACQPPADSFFGLVTRSMGGFYNVRTQARTYACKPRGIFRKEKTILLVGDRVRIEPLPDGSGVITELMARKNCFARPPISNLDKLFIVLSTTKPAPDFLFADKLTVVCACSGVEPVIVVNKSDLCAPDSVAAPYEKAGYAVVAVSAKTGAGLEEILRLAHGCISAFAGFSGAGKSSLLSRLLPEQLETGAVNEKLGRGRHTTRHTELFAVAPDSYIADTAGFSSLDILRSRTLRKEDLQNAFPEFRPCLGKCRWNACTHLQKEQDCAVREAVQSGTVAPSRYESYCTLFEQLKARPDWA